ncbi:MAG: hypothetical protein KTR22_06640 [Flavobacteriaceae bacterium]|nr:hypothetical protein [Flavobacteriaceae bacterium]
MDDQQGSSGTLLYVYDAVGTKLEKTFTDGGINPTTVVTQYAAGYVYQKYGTDPNDLQFFPHPEGYVEPTSASSGGNEKSIGKFNAGTGQTTQTGFRYVYQYRDHLGNVRLSYVDSDGNGSINPSGEIIEESHYYPFGLKQNGYNNNISSDANLVAQKWKYNGVELNEDLSLNLYEMEMRSYDPAIGRFLGIDPVTHHSQGTSVAFDNNPIFWADPSGADAAAPNSTVAANKGLPKEIQMAQNFGMGEHITHGAQLGNNSVPRDGGAAINTELSNAMHYPRVFSEMRANHNPDDYLISNGSNDNGDWEPLTKRVLVDYVSQYCTGCSKEALNSMAGQLFEQAFSDFALLNNLFLGYRPSPDKSESTIPDGYSDVTSYTNVGPVIYSGHNFIEVKTKNVTPDAQIRGFINELAIMGKVSGLPSNIPVSITFVTLADNYVTKGVYNYANKTLGKNGYGVFKTSKVDHWQPRYRMSQGSMEIDFGRRTILNFGRPLYNSNSIKVRL